MTHHERAIKVIAELLSIPVADIKPESVLKEDLRCDSLDLVELVMGIEDEFNIEIPDEDAEPLRKVSDVLAYVDKRVPAGN